MKFIKLGIYGYKNISTIDRFIVLEDCDEYLACAITNEDKDDEGRFEERDHNRRTWENVLILEKSFVTETAAQHWLDNFMKEHDLA